MLFISHSSKDLTTVAALVELIRSALTLPADDIRCTSLDGYRLPGGTNIDELLRQEVHDSQAFIGLISYDSLESTYVVFELGARWGEDKHLVPLLAPGVSSDVLKAPLSALNALRCDNASNLHQLVTELGGLLGHTPNSAASYQRYVDKVVALPHATEPIKIPKYLEEYLELNYAARKDRLPKSQQDILEWAEEQSERRSAIPQKGFEDAFRNRVTSVYWRLEALSLLGFFEKEVTDFCDTTPRYVYRLSAEYKASQYRKRKG
jgi:hypothetical protein